MNNIKNSSTNFSQSNQKNCRIRQLAALIQICGGESRDIFNLGKNITDQTLNDMSIKLNESLYGCSWRKNNECSYLFSSILTEDGFCFTFNSLNSRDIYTDEYDRGL